jgi:hypothetical protein
MYGLTILGIFHTAISLIAVASGAISLIKKRKINGDTTLDKIYIITTVIVCLTGFGIFQHNGFGVAHVLGIITLIVLGIALFAHRLKKTYIATVAFSMTFLLHLIPAINETMTRLPYGAPMAKSPDDPRIKMFIGICFILFLIGATLQVISIKKTKSK